MRKLDAARLRRGVQSKNFEEIFRANFEEICYLQKSVILPYTCGISSFSLLMWKEYISTICVVSAKDEDLLQKMTKTVFFVQKFN